MNSNYKISVILPVFNGGDFLKKSLGSVLTQEFTGYEVIICDDCSTDASLDYLEDMAKHFPDKIKLIKNDINLGLFKTLNKLINESSANLIHLWAQDDVMKKNCLEETFLFHTQYPNLSLSYHGFSYIDENDHIKIDEEIDGTPDIISKSLYARISVTWGCIAGNIANVTLSKPFLLKSGFFNEHMLVSGDFDLWTRLASIADIGFNRKKLMYLRAHDLQFSQNYNSIYNRIIEDIPIHHKLLSMLDKRDQNRGRKIYAWKTQTSYFNDIIFLFRKTDGKGLKRLIGLLSQETNIFLLLFRWFIIRFLRLIRVEILFYKKIMGK